MIREQPPIRDVWPTTPNELAAAQREDEMGREFPAVATEFRGQMLTRLECTAPGCGTCTWKCASFWDMSLHIPDSATAVSVQQLVDEHLAARGELVQKSCTGCSAIVVGNDGDPVVSAGGEVLYHKVAHRERSFLTRAPKKVRFSSR